MTDDIIVVVPSGTRVRYVESSYTNGKVIVLDARQIASTSSPVSAFFGVPVYEADRYNDESSKRSGDRPPK